jgi:hypothetical protein
MPMMPFSGAHGSQKARLGGIGVLGVQERAMALVGDGGVLEAQPHRFAEAPVAVLRLQEQHRGVDQQRGRGVVLERRRRQGLLLDQRPQHQDQRRARGDAVGRQRQHPRRRHAHHAGHQHAVGGPVARGQEEHREQAPRDRIEDGADEEPVLPGRQPHRPVAVALEQPAVDEARRQDQHLQRHPSDQQRLVDTGRQQQADQQAERDAAHKHRLRNQVQRVDALEFDLPFDRGRCVARVGRLGGERAGLNTHWGISQATAASVI